MSKTKDKLKNFIAAHPTLCEVARFLIVGGLATLLDMLVMGLVLYAFDPGLYPKFYNVWIGGNSPSTAATVVGTCCGFISGLILNYVLSVIFVFINKGESKSIKGFAIFAGLSAVGLGIHTGGMYIGYSLIGMNEWIVKIILTIVVLIYNYISKRFILFTPPDTSARERETQADCEVAAEQVQTDSGSEVKVISSVESVDARAEQTQDASHKKRAQIKISIVIPCYNEESCINEYYAAMLPIREKLGTEFEYIFVDDGSGDRTLELIKALAARDREIKYISFSRNFGKEAAIYAGLKNATGDLVGLMDADLQDPPEMLLDMYTGIVEEGYDCVGCRRTDRKGESKIRSAFARLFYKLINRMSDVEIVDGARDYRLMSRKMTDAVLEISERERFSKGIFGWVGFKTKWLEYKNTERIAGKTKWSFGKLTKYAVGGIEDFSTAPLKFNFVFAVTMFTAAVAFAVFDIVLACLGRDVSLLFILLPVICFIASMLGTGLTLIGEYIKKIFREVKARPIYIVRETDGDFRRTELDNKSTDEEEHSIKDAEQ